MGIVKCRANIHISVNTYVCSFFCLGYFSQDDIFQFHPMACELYKVIVFNFWVVLHSVTTFFCIHSSVEGHLGSIQLLGIVNKAAMNIVEHVPFLFVGICFGHMPRSRTAGFFLFSETPRLISKVDLPACSPKCNWRDFLFTHSLANICSHLHFWS